MELGNLIMGNSRGNYEVNRDLVNSDEWIYLVHTLLQVEDYHCVIGDYFEDYSTASLMRKPRTNNLTPTKYGGYVCEYNGEVIFEIFPYWWGDCTCGIDDKNASLRRKWKKELFTDYQWITYMTFEDWCSDECPACDWKSENKGKTQEELLKICTCGALKKNISLEKRKGKFKDKIKEYERREIEEQLYHNDDCLLIKHNFVYHPGRQDEVCIDWYKYPFRDSYINCDLSDSDIKAIFRCCAKYLKKVIKQNGGKY